MVIRKVNENVSERQLLIRSSFVTLMPIIFPEIDWVRNFSEEGSRLIDDALNCLYNAFNNDNKGSISYRKLCEGLLILCDDMSAPNAGDQNSVAGSAKQPLRQTASGSKISGQ